LEQHPRIDAVRATELGGWPIAILSARNRGVGAVVKPLLDLMQTMPAFVYLIPAIFLFGSPVGAARAFGSPPWRTLTRVQLPLALPTIMAGINQVIMLALSMVVIAGVVGAGGLGAVVFRAITRLDVGAGVEGGLAVVVLAGRPEVLRRAQHR
jgi:ABC-type proline/glycine betaine transport system permease subunit